MSPLHHEEPHLEQPRLQQLAYRMLGSVADAEDVVQDARVRLLKQDPAPDNESAWLFRVVTNLSLDRLREQKRQRAAYPGPWLPDPLPTTGPDDMTELAENLSLGLLLMLERLTPAQRVVFVLREGFELGYDDIADLVDSTAANCRQRYHRARSQLQGAEATNTPGQEQKAMLERLLVAVAEQDMPGLVQLFSDDCVAYTDGGGVVSAAIRPVTDPQRIAQVTLHLAGKLQADGSVEFHWTSLNGGVGLLVSHNGQLHSTVQLDVQDDRIRRLYIVRNPNKLAHLAAAMESSDA